MSKRLKFMTPICCKCGAKGDFVWCEDESAEGAPSRSYEPVSVTQLFTIEDGMIVCRLCNRATACIGSTIEPAQWRVPAG